MLHLGVSCQCHIVQASGCYLQGNLGLPGTLGYGIRSSSRPGWPAQMTDSRLFSAHRTSAFDPVRLAVSSSQVPPLSPLRPWSIGRPPSPLPLIIYPCPFHHLHRFVTFVALSNLSSGP